MSTTGHPIASAALVAKVYGILSYWSEARSRPMQGALLAWAQFAGVRPPMEGEDEASAASAAAAPSETAPLSPAHPSSSSAPSHSYPSSRRSGVPRGSLLEQFLRSPASRVERVRCVDLYGDGSLVGKPHLSSESWGRNRASAN